MKLGIAIGLALSSILIAPSPISGQPVDPPAAGTEVEQARRIAGNDLVQPLFLCRADGLATVRDAMESSNEWLIPTKAFDNLFFVGNAFVGVWVLKTSAGLILFDSTESEEQARDHLVPGLKTLGLDPATIRYVVVTHGHFDHFGGAAWLQRTYGARIALSAADWDMIEALPTGALERQQTELPRRDLIVSDGETLRLGDSVVRLYLTPGHTPGTVSAIVPARTGRRTVSLSLFGSVAFPPSLDPTPRAGGLRVYDQSVQRFARVSREAGAQGILNTHIFADGTRQRLDTLRTLGASSRNPFLIGADATRRYYAVLHHCLLAAQIRAESSGGTAGISK
jgi:metallo-beta-lactamase class B